MSDHGSEPLGKYQVIKRLSVGESSEVFLAKASTADGEEDEIVLKLLSKDRASDKNEIDEFILEAKISTLLSHENIVQSYDLMKVGDDFCLTMEQVKGMNLRDLLVRCGELKKPLPAELAIHIVSEVCKGLDYIHKETDRDNAPLNIVWRNLSTKHVMVSYDGDVKMLDFSIANSTLEADHSMADILKGEIFYMSPEQALGKTADSRSDIFSAGILLHELLLGNNPFLRDTAFATMKAIRSKNTIVDSIPDDVAVPIKSILLKAMAYDPDQRYAEAEDMRKDLTKYLGENYPDFQPKELGEFVVGVGLSV